MGIPLYFKTIVSDYPEIIKDIKDVNQVNRLFLDLNCAIHPCCRKITNENFNPLKKLENENKMLNEINNYIQLLVKIVSPQLLYVAIDGVAPRAKMAQQKLRRYKTIKEKEVKNKIHRELNIEEEDNKWDTNAITPGTEFMARLSNYLQNEFNNNNFYGNIDIIFSNSNVPGEGEHKIFEYIRENNNDNLIDVVYGLDADLIMLSLAAKKNNIYLLREALEFGKMYYESGYKFLYLDIDNFKNCLLAEIKSDLYTYTNYNNENLNDNSFINDYVFLCFILGNDFLPHLTSVDLRNNGMNTLLKIYVKTYSNNYKFPNLIDTDRLKVNTEFIRDIFNNLSELEQETLEKIQTKRSKFKLRKPYENDLEKKLDLLHNYPILNREKEDIIDFKSEGWEKRYYKICHNIKSQNEIDNLCHNYIEGLTWILSYYFKTCKSWQWEYKYRHPPLLKDIFNYFNKLENINKIDIKKGSPNKPFEQLLYVLPSKSSHLLPKSYQNLVLSNSSPIIEYYPNDYNLDCLYKKYFWQCQPILPYIPQSDIKNATVNLKLNSEELLRNKTGKNILINKKFKKI